MAESNRYRRVAPRVLLQLIPGLAFLAVWQFLGVRPSIGFFFSTPLDVAKTMGSLIGSGELQKNLAVTAFEALAGFVLGNVVGSAFGIGLWYSETSAWIAKPYLTILGSVPVFALAPMTILWFGIGVGAKVALAFLGTVLVAAAQAHRGVRLADPLLVRRFRVFGASRAVVFRHLLLPSAALWIVGSLRLTIGSALLGAFVGEFIASDRGLGHLIVRASGLYDAATVIAGVISMALMALALDSMIDMIEASAQIRHGGGSPDTGSGR
jgi:NitT/TauT family transport system permease protein